MRRTRHLARLPRITITVLLAGTNSPSNSETLAEEFIKGMEEASEVRVERFRLRDVHLPHFTVPDYDLSHPPQELQQLRRSMESARGVVIATPIWNFSVPAHLKNTIDWIGTFGLDEQTHSKGQFKGKPFALLQTGGAPMIAWKALMYLTTLHLPEAIKYYGGSVILRHFEPKCVEGKGKFGLVVDKRPGALAAMRKKGASFARAASMYEKTGHLPFVQQFRYQFFTFLYRVGNRIMYPISKMQ